MQQLLPLVPSEIEGTRYELPTRFDARTAPSRIAIAALADQRPRDLEDGGTIDVASLLERHDVQAFARLVTVDGDGLGSVGNRVLHGCRDGGLYERVRARAVHDPLDRVLRSHGIDEDAAAFAVAGDRRAFVAARERAVRTVIVRFLEKMTRFGYGDRPSIASLVAAAQRATG